MQALSKSSINVSSTLSTLDASYFDESAPIRKTLAGHREFEQRRLPLSAELRRLLILIDGKRSTQSLAFCVRKNELAQLLEALREKGLIEASSAKPIFMQTSVRNEARLLHGVQKAQFDAVRHAAMSATRELLGEFAKPYCIALTLCRDRSRLQEILNEIDDRLRSMLGGDVATMFCEVLKDALHASIAMPPVRRAAA
jgi:hypothetical protein